MSDCTATRLCHGPDCEQQLSGRQTKYCSRRCERRWHREANGDRIRAQEAAGKARYPERVRAAKRAWYEANAELTRERASVWYYANTDRALASARQRYERNGDVIRARAAAYRKANPDKCRAWDAKYRSLRGASGEVFDPVEIFERDGWICGICTEPIDPQVGYPDHAMASLDHVIPLSRGGEHTRDNTQASHLRCNKRKHACIA